jgi:hypothetical protein
MSKKSIDVFHFINDPDVKFGLSKALKAQGFICTGADVRFKKTKHLVLDLTLKEVEDEKKLMDS